MNLFFLFESPRLPRVPRLSVVVGAHRFGEGLLVGHAEESRVQVPNLPPLRSSTSSAFNP